MVRQPRSSSHVAIMSTSDLPPHEWMTTEELAAWMRVPVDSIYWWRRNGQAPPAYKIGRHLRWHRDDIEYWLRERRQEAA